MRSIPELFIEDASKKLGVYDRYIRFVKLVREYNRAGRCMPRDELMHYVDGVYMKILSNASDLALIVNDRDVPRYWRSRLGRALLTGDKSFIKWFISKYPVHVGLNDPVVTQNVAGVPWLFGVSNYICSVTNGTCSSSANEPCESIYQFPNTPTCCTSYAYFVSGNAGFASLVDNVPWVSQYSTGLSGLNYGYLSSPGSLLVTSSISVPSCFPTSGVTVDLDFGAKVSTSSATCASSCPSGTACGATYVHYCPGSTYLTIAVPLLYYIVNLTVGPGQSYSVWWEISV
jgi:hypothetical protein